MKKKHHFKEHKFWVRKAPSNNARKYDFNYFELLTFLNKNHYYLFDKTIIKLEKKFAFEKTAEDIFKDCSKYIEQQKNKDLIHDFLWHGETLLLNRKGILLSLKRCKLMPLRDTKDEGFLYFENCIISITESKIKILNKKEIKKLNGFFWSKSVIQKSITINNEKSQISKFLELVTNNKDHYLYAKSIIGYLLHKYKDPSNAVAIILSDSETEIHNIANGGSGKGIIMNAINKIVNVIFENGKNVNLSTNKFVYQNIQIDTDIFFLDDVKENFDFENLFSIITTNMLIEKKGKTPFEITFGFSPKIVITTNYTIIEKGESSIRRKKVLFLNNYFNLNHTPKQEFNNLFFDDWDDKEWVRFYNFMIHCIQIFLKNGIVDFKNKELEYTKFISETSKDFFELMENKYIGIGTFYKLDDLTKIFNLENPKIMVKWIKLYANYKNYIYTNKLKTGITFFAFQNKK